MVESSPPAEAMVASQFLMAYEATIASAGGDDSTMAKSFVMACEGSVDK